MDTLLALLRSPLSAVTAVTPPIRVLAVQPAGGFGDTSTPKSSPTFDVVAGDLLVLQAFSEDSTVTLGTPTWDGTGTWTLQQSVVVSSYCTAYLFTCPVTATATGRTITVTQTGGLTRMWSFIASLWRNHGGLGVTGKANVTGGLPALTLPVSAGSAVVCGNSDWAAVDGTTRTWKTVNGAPMTEAVYFRSAANYTMYAGYSIDTAGLVGGPETLGLVTPGGQTYAVLGAEIKGTIASGPTVWPITSTTPATAGGSSAPTLLAIVTSTTAAVADGSSAPTKLGTVFAITSATASTADGSSSATLRAATTSTTAATSTSTSSASMLAAGSSTTAAVSASTTTATLLAPVTSATAATANGSSVPTARYVATSTATAATSTSSAVATLLAKVTSATAATADGSSSPTLIGGANIYPVTSTTAATADGSSAARLIATAGSVTTATSATTSTARLIASVTSLTAGTSGAASTTSLVLAITATTNAVSGSTSLAVAVMRVTATTTATAGGSSAPTLIVSAAYLPLVEADHIRLVPVRDLVRLVDPRPDRTVPVRDNLRTVEARDYARTVPTRPHTRSVP